ncbi:MAG: hypothetical protein WCZ98_04695 [Sideroxydans sp.]
MSEAVARTIIWRSPAGEVIACVEKNKVLQENLVEIRQVCQDAFEDAVIMGCDEQQIRAVFIELMNNLESAYPPQE